MGDDDDDDDGDAVMLLKFVESYFIFRVQHLVCLKAVVPRQHIEYIDDMAVISSATVTSMYSTLP